MQDKEKDETLQAINELTPLERRIIEARFLCKRSERKDRQALANELGLTVGLVEELETNF